MPCSDCGLSVPPDRKKVSQPNLPSAELCQYAQMQWDYPKTQLSWFLQPSKFNPFSLKREPGSLYNNPLAQNIHASQVGFSRI